ncbi:MAG TPA: TrkH family potassium uptake protein [Methanothermococcus okinawensis]|uniref:TrkH family potassium uptake protein n=1 Tax=Methanothermococcus okinawensis TaxID=155863 RepID=A0A832ZGA5_9EURY|nr:TrkH family potassium uptake protein [Methanothermococcus okinawensis]HIP91617.1 TrkH family potassium uptake protein [Methanothermococcus okinawensis]
MEVFKGRDIIGVIHELGILITLLGILMFIPTVIGWYYREPVWYFLYPSLLITLTGILVYRFTEPVNIELKHAMIISPLAWLLASIIGAIPFYLGIPYFSYLDGVFESMSAWTTTGFTLVKDVENLPCTLQFWRSLEQWIGGIGVLVMVISILSKTGISTYYRAEAREEKILPSTVNTVRKIWEIYILYTLIGVSLLYLAGLPIWDAINLSMCGISTGGMSIKNSSFPYNNLAKVVMISIMILGGIISFAVHHRILTGRWMEDIQGKVGLTIVLIASIVVMLSSGIDFIDALFTVVSAITSTGYSTVSIASLSDLSLFIILLLMMIGGSTGTTTGGIKLIRLIVILKSLYYHIQRALLPPNVLICKRIGKSPLSQDLVIDASVIGFAYLIHYCITTIFLISLGYLPFKSLFEGVSLVANIGLSLNVVNHSMHPLGKILGIFMMWAGRLEFIPVYVLLLYLFRKLIKR